MMLAVFLLALSAGTPPTPVEELASSKAVPATADTGPVREMRDDSSHHSELPLAAAGDRLDEKRLTDAKDDGLKLEPQSWNQAMGAYQSVLRNDATEESRYLVWSPFRSRWAAQGFARRLTLATEVPVEVVNEAPGNYQVVFSYRNDGERQAMVRRIEAVTGLELE
jgi:hypothetical protein